MSWMYGDIENTNLGCLTDFAAWRSDLGSGPATFGIAVLAPNEEARTGSRTEKDAYRDIAVAVHHQIWP
jgi:hypothetical protein